ncbi:MAG: hypothetical protein LQ346_003337 [Caloplaca aetnensis]|nr:MAG: hypothetical protein LQ346_003337 [Caloplaca aetnensis]
MVEYYGFLQLGHDQDTQRKQECRPDQCTIISLTLGDQPDHVANVKSWLACGPGAVLVVTIAEKLEKVRVMLDSLGDPRIRVYSVRQASAREQVSEGIRRTTTPFLVVVDDDVRWSMQTLQQLAVALSDRVVGGVTTVQQVCPSSGRFLTTWESFGALNLVRRNVLHAFVAYFANGHVLNLSGRTSAYRTRIFQCPEFHSAFRNDYWRGRHHLRTGDDNFLTSWVVQRGWQTRFVNDPNALITTTVGADSTYLKQLLRWSRDTARGYLRDTRFALSSCNASFLFYCFMKTLANYASDLAVILDVGLLLVVTMSRGSDAVGGGRPTQM